MVQKVDGRKKHSLARDYVILYSFFFLFHILFSYDTYLNASESKSQVNNLCCIAINMFQVFLILSDYKCMENSIKYKTKL